MNFEKETFTFPIYFFPFCPAHLYAWGDYIMVDMGSDHTAHKKGTPLPLSLFPCNPNSQFIATPQPIVLILKTGQGAHWLFINSTGFSLSRLLSQHWNLDIWKGPSRLPASLPASFFIKSQWMRRRWLQWVSLQCLLQLHSFSPQWDAALQLLSVSLSIALTGGHGNVSDASGEFAEVVKEFVARVEKSQGGLEEGFVFV